LEKKVRVKIKKGWIFLAVLLLLLLFIGIRPTSGETVKTVNPEFQVISTEFPVDVIFSRDEEVIRSPGRGQVFFEDLIDGERVRVNQQVATLVTQTFDGVLERKPITISNAGVLSFYTDGFEELLWGRQIGELDLIGVKNRNFGQYMEYKSEGAFVEQGTPIFRIINPFSDVNFILYFPKGYVIKNGFELSELESNSLILKSDSDEYRISITNVGLAGESVFCSGRVLSNRGDFFNIRKERFILVLERQEGYLISKEAIVYEEEGEPGVFIQNRRSYDWVRVDILKVLSDKALIAPERPGSIVINPQVL